MQLIFTRSPWSFAGVVGVVCVIEWWIASSIGLVANAELLALAITADLIVGIPLLYYFFFVHTRRRPLITIGPVFILAFVMAHLILPSTHHSYLDQLELLLPLIEGVVLLGVLFKLRAIMRAYRQVRPTSIYATDALLSSLQQVLGVHKLLPMFITELTTPYYVTLGWFKTYKPIHVEHQALTYHRRSGYGLVIGLFSFLIIVETLLVHLLVQHWSPAAAWILTGLSIYSLIWMLADYQAVRLHPIVLTPEQLYLRTGLRWRVDLAWSNIERIESTTWRTRYPEESVNTSIYGAPKLLLTLREPVTIQGPFGMRKQAQVIGITVDQPNSLLDYSQHHI